MKRAALVLLVVPLVALWLYGCDGEPPSAPETTTEATALFGKVPTDPTACYTAATAALEAAEAYGEAAKDLAKCDQAAKGPCDVEQAAHVTTWLELSDLYESALAICGGEPPSENLPPEISSVEISPNPAYPDTPDLTCQAVYSDPDGDDLSVTYKWLKDGSATEAIGNVYDGTFLTGETYTCEVTVSDGQAQDVASRDVVIAEALCEPSATESRECPYGDPEIRTCQGDGTWGPWTGCAEPNTPPYIIGVAIVPEFPTTTTQSLECTYADFGDADGDNVTLTYEWFGAGGSGVTSNTLSLGSASVGQQFYCKITADDGTEQAMEQSQVVTIASSLDQDGDGVLDSVDQCPAGESGWTSDATTDHDGDGCRDATEDLDDDNDGVLDTEDSCPRGMTGWTSDPGSPSSPGNDLDEDGCHDSAEDSEIVKFVGGFIEEDQLWIRGVDYRVVEDLYVQGPLSPVLTIEDGVTVEAMPNTHIYVGETDRGALVASGLNTGILFTSASTSPDRGDWGGISIGYYNQGTLLDGVTVEYGGGNGLGNVVCYPAQTSTVTTTIRNSTIQHSSDYGIYRQPGANVVLENNVYNSNFDGPLFPEVP